MLVQLSMLRPCLRESKYSVHVRVLVCVLKITSYVVVCAACKDFLRAE